MKIKNLKVDKKNIADKIKRGVAVAGCILVLTASLTGCMNRSTLDINNTEYTYSEGTKKISEYYEVITDKDINNLPSSVEELSLSTCQYVHDLNELPHICPNIRVLKLKNCSSIVDISFIMRFPNLEKVELNDMAGISVELLEYLEENGIEYNISEDDIEASKKVDEIISEIITDDMTDEEKIKAICLYVSNNCKYRITKVFESNDDPLTTTLLTEKGVCAGIAYTTNVLLRKAGITSYEVVNDLHAWNIVEQDEKYYYLDVTNIGAPILPKFISRPLIKHFGFSDGYMSSPSTTAFTAMSPYDNRSKVLIPSELVEDIKKGEDEKTLIDRYGNNVPVHVIEALIVLIGLVCGIKLASAIKDKIKYR